MSEKEWTSLSATQTQKQVLQDAKPDSMAMGEFLVGLIDGEPAPSETPDLTTLEAKISETASLVEELTNRETDVTVGD